MTDDIDRRNREALKSLSSQMQEPPLTVTDILCGMWDGLTDAELEAEAMEQRHVENMDKRRGGQG